MASVEVRQEGEVLDLALAPGGHAVDLAGAGVEGGEQVGGAGPAVLVLDLDRSPRLGGPGRHAAWAGLERGHLVEAEHHLVLGQEAGQQVGDGPDLRGERRVTGGAGVQPDVRIARASSDRPPASAGPSGARSTPRPRRGRAAAPARRSPTG